MLLSVSCRSLRLLIVIARRRSWLQLDVQHFFPPFPRVINLQIMKVNSQRAVLDGVCFFVGSFDGSDLTSYVIVCIVQFSSTSNAINFAKFRQRHHRYFGPPASTGTNYVSVSRSLFLFLLIYLYFTFNPTQLF
jgi:hypothetical protein